MARRRALAGLVCALAFASTAHAAFGTAYKELVCRDLGDVATTFNFTASFVGVPNCTSLCIAAFRVCLRDVKDASSCQTAFATDWIALDSAVDCAGLTGSDLSDCKAGWALDLSTWKLEIKSALNSAESLCTQNLNQCGQCAGH
jgi:hypothetical protein